MRRVVLLLAVLATVSGVGASGAAAAAAGYESADVGVSATAASGTIVTGQSTTFTVTAVDNGPADAQGVVVSESLKGKVEVTAATAPDGVCSISATKRHVLCRFDKIAHGATAQISMTVTADAPGTLATTSYIKANNPDPDTSNQTAVLQTKLVETNPPTGVGFTGTTFTHRILPRPQFPVSWTATDTGSRVASFDVRYRSGAYNGAFGAYRVWKQATVDRNARFAGVPGTTYCFSVRATDRDGNISAWTPDRCVSILLQSPTLVRSGIWKLHKSKSGGTASLSSRAQGSQLMLRNVVAKQVAISAAEAPGYGKLEVFWNGHLVRTFALAAPTRRHLLLPLPPFATSGPGTLVLRVASPKQTVTVFGVGITKEGGVS